MAISRQSGHPHGQKLKSSTNRLRAQIVRIYISILIQRDAFKKNAALMWRTKIPKTC